MYKPLPGSLPERVIKWFLINKQEELTRQDIASKFDVPLTSVEGGLATAMAHKYIAKVRSGNLVVFTAGPQITQAAEPQEDPQEEPRTAKRGALVRRDRLPTLDVTGLSFSYDIPPPDNTVIRRGSNKYQALFERLDKPGASVTGIDISYRAAINKAATKFTKDHGGQEKGPCFTVRTIDVGTVGVWRTK